jgi:cytochrome c oxidase cbb3-type subunit 3
MTQPTSEQDRLLDHSYDGIQEFDNPLPRWWVWIFWASIAFAAVYGLVPNNPLRGPGRLVEYNAALAEAARLHPPVPEASEASLLALTRDPKALAAGKQVFVTTCAPCHRPDAGGLIGPNLTDDYWLHGGTITEIHHTITNGVLEKGMPNWGKMLKPEQVTDVAAYVYTLRGSNPPNPKEPQGVLVAREK